MSDSLTAARLRRLLDYEPTIGIFRWRANGRGRYMRAGAQAGTINKDGYRQICVDCVLYLAADLAWLWMTGRRSPLQINHANGIFDDDRWSNLREATYSQAAATMRPKASLKGVTWDKARGKFAARIKVNYRTTHLGRFDNPQEAHAAYVAAARKYFGEFARP